MYRKNVYYGYCLKNIFYDKTLYLFYKSLLNPIQKIFFTTITRISSFKTIDNQPITK